MLLTIAIICKNEEKNIERCLNSVFEALVDMDKKCFEVILADSFSTDDTLNIASKFPLKIIQLGEEWPHSAAAGRYTAFRYATGKYTLILDADMELAPGFIPPALEYMENNPRAGAVGGIIEHMVYYDDSLQVTNVSRGELIPENPGNWSPERACLIKSVPGAGVFRTAEVLRVGNFHPFLRAEEEFELCQRLRNADAELWYLPMKIAKHYGYLSIRYKELQRRLKRGHMLGTGEMFKWSLSHGYVRENILRFRVYLVIAVYLCIFPVVIIINQFSLLLWIAGLSILLSSLIIKKRSFSIGVMEFLHKILMALGILLKLPVRIKEPSTYPTDVRIMDFSEKDSCGKNGYLSAFKSADLF